MGVAFQCMVRLTVYAMSYKLYVVEWYDRRELVRDRKAGVAGVAVRSNGELSTQMRFSSRNGL